MSASRFNRLPVVPDDPIFAVSARAKAAGPDAIDGTVGMLYDEKGTVMMLPSVRQTIERLHSEPVTHFAYTPLTGVPEFRKAVGVLLGNPEHMASVATTGGTEGVAVNLQLLKLMQSDACITVPVPTWSNHNKICNDAGIAPTEVPYLENGTPHIGAIVDSLRSGSQAVLLHASCHNPTGLDLSVDQWEELARDMGKHDAVALIDMAYQGFAGSPEEDAEPIRIMQKQGVTTLIAWSASKNHSIYDTRTGLAGAIAPDAKTAATITKNYQALIRGQHSSSPAYGQRIVAATQESLPNDWRMDLKRSVRGVIEQRRAALAAILGPEFGPIAQGKGMFTLLPLSPDALALLEQENVFLAPDGRINIGGIPLNRMDELGEKILKVTRR